MMPLPPSPLRVQHGALTVRRPNASSLPSIPMGNVAIQAHYSAAKASRFRRTRTGIGGPADAHYALGLDYYTIREYARDMDRNDAIFGQLVDRACDNIGPLTPIPQTGDKDIDREIAARWESWASDPSACDVTGRHTFPELERLVDRSEFIDGDIFALPLDSGSIQLVEADYVDSPSSFGDTIHGVKIAKDGRPLEYWFIDEPMRMRSMTGPRHAINTTKVAARGPDGESNVLHIYDPGRVSQTRGVTVFKSVLDIAGMFEDVNFAVLIKQQVAACIAAFIQSPSDVQFGARSNALRSDGDDDILEEMAPGMIARLKPGQTIATFSPAVPAAEYHDHVRLLLRLIGAPLGMPLCLVLNDTSNTTFHGYRGELQQARLQFERRRSTRERRFNRPVYRWKVRQWLRDLGLRAESLGAALFRHKWTGQRFPYVEPKTDAEADKVRLDNMLISPRDLAAERGDSWEDIVAETVADRAALVRAAIVEAQAIEAESGVAIGWRDLLNLSTPAGVQAAAAPAPIPEENRPEPAQKVAARYAAGEVLPT